MDITPLFKACIKTLRTRNKALGLGEKDKAILGLNSRGNKIKSEFALKAKEVVSFLCKYLIGNILCRV